VSSRENRGIRELRRALDPVVLFEDAVGPADDWQRRILRSTAKRRILLLSRQAGKSQTCAILALHKALYSPGSLVLCIAPALRQSVELTQKTLAAYKDLGLGELAPPKYENRLSLELENGSRIITLPGTEKTIRGYSAVSLLVIDEASRVDDALFYAVQPMLAVSGGAIILLSTPWGRRGFFYETWERGEQADLDAACGWERYKVTAEDVPRITPEFLAEERANLPDRVYAQEYECEFVETGEQVFSEAVIAGITSDDFEPLDI
jgi:hypothetical protein